VNQRAYSPPDPGVIFAFYAEFYSGPKQQFVG